MPASMGSSSTTTWRTTSRRRPAPPSSARSASSPRRPASPSAGSVRFFTGLTRSPTTTRRDGRAVSSWPAHDRGRARAGNGKPSDDCRIDLYPLAPRAGTCRLRPLRSQGPRGDRRAIAPGGKIGCVAEHRERLLQRLPEYARRDERVRRQLRLQAYRRPLRYRQHHALPVPRTLDSRAGPAHQERAFQGVLEEGDRPYPRLVPHIAGRHHQLAGRHGSAGVDKLLRLSHVRVFSSVPTLPRGPHLSDFRRARSDPGTQVMSIPSSFWIDRGCSGLHHASHLRRTTQCPTMSSSATPGATIPRDGSPN